MVLQPLIYKHLFTIFGSITHLIVLIVHYPLYIEIQMGEKGLLDKGVPLIYPT
jgi:hypothetical protein